MNSDKVILLVEDNPVNQEVAVGMLESLSCNTHAADNGWVAIEALNAFRDSPRGTLRLNVGRMPAMTVIAPMLARFIE